MVCGCSSGDQKEGLTPLVQKCTSLSGVMAMECTNPHKILYSHNLNGLKAKYVALA
jgi:hypothetical protein